MQFDNLTLSDKMNLYEKGFSELKTALDSVSDEVLSFTPAPEHWTAKQIAIHLADTEGIYFIRFRRAIGESGAELLGFKNDDWAKDLNYSEQDLNFTMQVLDVIRQSNFRILNNMPQNYWTDKKYKSNNELFSMEKLLERNLNHFYGHLDVIKKRFDQHKAQR